MPVSTLGNFIKEGGDVSPVDTNGIIAAFCDLGPRKDASTGTTWAYYGGKLPGGVTVADGTVTLTDDATNYVECDAAGTVSVNTTGYTGTGVSMQEVEVASGVATLVSDDRSWLGGGGSLLPDPTGHADGEVLTLDEGVATWAALPASDAWPLPPAGVRSLVPPLDRWDFATGLPIGWAPELLDTGDAPTLTPTLAGPEGLWALALEFPSFTVVEEAVLASDAIPAGRFTAGDPVGVSLLVRQRPAGDNSTPGLEIGTWAKIDGNWEEVGVREGSLVPLTYDWGWHRQWVELPTPADATDIRIVVRGLRNNTNGHVSYGVLAQLAVYGDVTGGPFAYAPPDIDEAPFVGDLPPAPLEVALPGTLRVAALAFEDGDPVDEVVSAIPATGGTAAVPTAAAVREAVAAAGGETHVCHGDVAEPDTWAANTTYAANAIVRPPWFGYQYICTVGGTTAGEEPAWRWPITPDTPVTFGTATFELYTLPLTWVGDGPGLVDGESLLLMGEVAQMTRGLATGAWDTSVTRLHCAFHQDGAESQRGLLFDFSNDVGVELDMPTNGDPLVITAAPFSGRTSWHGVVQVYRRALP